MSNFETTINPTPFGFFDSDVQFRDEANRIVTFVKRKLGDDVLSVELTKKQIWACLEESLLEYGSVINQYQARSQLSNYLGQPTGSLEDGTAQNAYPRANLEFLQRQAEPYSGYAGVGGSYDAKKGAITLVPGKQEYDLHADLIGGDGSSIFDAQDFGRVSKLRIHEVFHFSPAAAYRFFNSSSAINYLNNEFKFESFTPETVFYVLPVFEDILRSGMMDLSRRVRRSNYSYQIVGKNIKIFPVPTDDNPGKLFISVFTMPDPLNPDYQDDTINGVSNLSNIPYGNIQYTNINAIGRQWVRQYCLALCKELLGLVRSKFNSIPIPNAEVTLNGDNLITQAREDKEKLMTELKEILDSMTYDKILEKEADKAESIQNQLKHIPMPLGMAITTG